MVLHFGVPMNSPQVKVLDTWRTLGMRGTGSHDVLDRRPFVPEAAVARERKAGEWHPLFHTIATIAFPLVYAVYLGVAESARDIAIGARQARAPGRPCARACRADGNRAHGRPARQRVDAGRGPLQRTVGRRGESGHDRPATGCPSRHRGRGSGDGARRGAGFYRAAGLERRFRDIQAARYHPLQSGPQAQYAGALALGLPVKQIF